jgi:hypothetical protein
LDEKPIERADPQTVKLPRYPRQHFQASLPRSAVVGNVALLREPREEVGS